LNATINCAFKFHAVYNKGTTFLDEILTLFKQQFISKSSKKSFINEWLDMEEKATSLGSFYQVIISRCARYRL